MADRDVFSRSKSILDKYKRLRETFARNRLNRGRVTYGGGASHVADAPPIVASSSEGMLRRHVRVSRRGSLDIDIHQKKAYRINADDLRSPVVARTDIPDNDNKARIDARRQRLLEKFGKSASAIRDRKPVFSPVVVTDRSAPQPDDEREGDTGDKKNDTFKARMLSESIHAVTDLKKRLREANATRSAMSNERERLHQQILDLREELDRSRLDSAEEIDRLKREHRIEIESNLTAFSAKMTNQVDELKAEIRLLKAQRGRTTAHYARKIAGMEAKRRLDNSTTTEETELAKLRENVIALEERSVAAEERWQSERASLVAQIRYLTNGWTDERSVLQKHLEFFRELASARELRLREVEQVRSIEIDSKADDSKLDDSYKMQQLKYISSMQCASFGNVLRDVEETLRREIARGQTKDAVVKSNVASFERCLRRVQLALEAASKRERELMQRVRLLKERGAQQCEAFELSLRSVLGTIEREVVSKRTLKKTTRAHFKQLEATLGPVLDALACAKKRETKLREIVSKQVSKFERTLTSVHGALTDAMAREKESRRRMDRVRSETVSHCARLTSTLTSVDVALRNAMEREQNMKQAMRAHLDDTASRLRSIDIALQSSNDRERRIKTAVRAHLDETNTRLRDVRIAIVASKRREEAMRTKRESLKSAVRTHMDDTENRLREIEGSLRSAMLREKEIKTAVRAHMDETADSLQAVHIALRTQDAKNAALKRATRSQIRAIETSLGPVTEVVRAESERRGRFDATKTRMLGVLDRKISELEAVEESLQLQVAKVDEAKGVKTAMTRRIDGIIERLVPVGEILERELSERTHAVDVAAAEDDDEDTEGY